MRATAITGPASPAAIAERWGGIGREDLGIRALLAIDRLIGALQSGDAVTPADLQRQIGDGFSIRIELAPGWELRWVRPAAGRGEEAG
jgi:hypothetical protein